MSSFTCPICSATSHHPADELYGYCARCRAVTSHCLLCSSSPVVVVNDTAACAEHLDDLVGAVVGAPFRQGGFADVVAELLRCRDCGNVLDGFTGASEDAVLPDDGSLSVCGYCACISFFSVVGGIVFLRAPFPAELAELENDSEVTRLVRMVRSNRNPLRKKQSR